MLLILLKTFWAHFIFEYTTLGLKNAPDEINPIWSANKSTLAKLGVRRKLPAGHKNHICGCKVPRYSSRLTLATCLNDQSLE